jgi:hypothetical protein
VESRTFIRRTACSVVLALLLAACAAVELAAQADSRRLIQLETRYQSEKDPVRAARLLAQIGPLQVDKARNAFKEGGDEQALDIISAYRDEVHAAWDRLTAMGVDPVKKPAGFKDLQIGLRTTVRRLDEFIFIIPVDKRPWFQAVRTDLAQTESKLINVLFDRSSGGARG